MTLLDEMTFSSSVGCHVNHVFGWLGLGLVWVVANSNGCDARNRGSRWRLTFSSVNRNQSGCLQGASWYCRPRRRSPHSQPIPRREKGEKRERIRGEMWGSGYQNHQQGNPQTRRQLVSMPLLRPPSSPLSLFAFSSALLFSVAPFS